VCDYRVAVEKEFNKAANTKMEKGSSNLCALLHATLPLDYGMKYRYNVCPESQWFIDNSIFIPAPEVTSLDVYVDGGFKEDTRYGSSWSVLLVVWDRFNNHYCIGCTGGAISHDSGCRIFLGEKVASAFEAELFAQILARLAIIQHAHKYISCKYTPISICYDSKGANVAATQSRITVAQPDLALICNALECLTRQLYPNLNSHHIHSHRSQPFNELADAICTHYLGTHSEVHDLGYRHYEGAADDINFVC
jgi:hypothetical protein